jgi:hypothetical protein
VGHQIVLVLLVVQGAAQMVRAAVKAQVILEE